MSMDSEDRSIVWAVALICAVVGVGFSWLGYFQVNETNVENETRQVVTRSCQEELDTDLVQCAYDTMNALRGEEPDE